MMPVLHSTKDLTILRPPAPGREGAAIFEYTDHYSLFHYGRMPDAIPGKGQATCRMAAYNFALLEEAGIPTHFRRFLPPNRIEFSLAPDYAPGAAPPAPGGCRLLPVQVLVRTELPQGSSVHRRLVSGELDPAEVGLDAIPAIGEKLPRPIVEYATMREETNRFLTPPQAQDLAGLDDEQFAAMRRMALNANEVLSAHARTVGLSHCDGKTEFLISSSGRLVLADSPGTPDESRLMVNGMHCGKQVLRNWYVDNGLEVPVSTLIAQGVPRARWPRPAPLPPHILPVMSDLYRALCQTWTGERLWQAPDLDTAARAVARTIGR